jgi:hypothetical protein
MIEKRRLAAPYRPSGVNIVQQATAAVPTGCAGGGPGPDVVETHRASGRRVAAGMY